MNWYCSCSKRLLQIKCRGAWVSLTDRKVELRDGVKAIDGPKGGQKSIELLYYSPSTQSSCHKRQTSVIFPLTIMLRLLWDGCYCNKRPHYMLSHQYIFYLWKFSSWIRFGTMRRLCPGELSDVTTCLVSTGQCSLCFSFVTGKPKESRQTREEP